MKIEYRKTKEDNIIQITTADERWYYDEEKGVYAPSVTWICGSYPKGIQFYKWLAQTGWDESQALKNAAGIRGSKVHQAIDYLNITGELSIDIPFVNSQNGQQEQLLANEIEAVLSFADWHEKTKPTLLRGEQVIWYDDGEIRFAGTVDAEYLIDEAKTTVDFKTSQSIWTEYELQVSAYKKALNSDKAAILQIGYNKNKPKWKFTEIPDKWELFKHTYHIWLEEHSGDSIYQKDFPKSITITK